MPRRNSARVSAAYMESAHHNAAMAEYYANEAATAALAASHYDGSLFGYKKCSKWKHYFPWEECYRNTYVSTGAKKGAGSTQSNQDLPKHVLSLEEFQNNQQQHQQQHKQWLENMEQSKQQRQQLKQQRQQLKQQLQQRRNIRKSKNAKPPDSLPLRGTELEI